MKHIKMLFLLLAMIFSFSTFLSASPEDVFLRANQAYKQEQYKIALGLYDSLLQEGYSSGPLLFNIGNAHFRQQNYSAARLYYEKALEELGSDEELLHNLSLTREKLGAGPDVEPESLFQALYWRLLEQTTVEGYAWLTIFLFWIGMAGVALFLLVSKVQIRKAGFFGGIFIIFLAVITGFLTYELHNYRVGDDRGIIFKPGVFVKSSPSETGTDLVIVHEGKKVRIVDQLEGWYEIELENEKRGWVKDEDIQVI